MRIFKIIFLALIFISSIYSSSFEKYNISNGLSSNNILTLFQDSDGFIWLGCDNGLLRYDGYEFVKIYNSAVFSITEDKEKNIYIAIPGAVKKISTNNLRWEFEVVYEGQVKFLNYFSDHLLITTPKKGLLKFNSAKNKFSSVEIDEVKKLRIDVLKEDQGGNLILASNRGLFSLNSKFDIRKISDLNLITNHTDRITDLEIWGNYLFIGTSKNGIIKYNLSDNSYEWIKEKNDSNPAVNKKGHILTDNRITKIKLLENKLWIGTRGGLNKYDLLEKTNDYYFPNLNDEKSISGEVINDILIDNASGIWVGTFLNGLNYKANKYREIKNIKYEKNKFNSISSPKINNVLLDENNILWLGTKGAGLNSLDFKLKKVLKIFSERNREYGINNNYITAITETKGGEVLVGTAGPNVYSYDRENEKFKVLKNTVDSGIKNVSFIFEEDKNNIWIGTYENGIFKYNPSNYTIHKIEVESNGLNYGFWSIFKYKGQVYFTTISNGLLYFNQENSRIQKWGFSELFFKSVEKLNGNLWAIEPKLGLIQINLETKEITKADESISWDDFAINIIVSDGLYDLWMAGRNKIINYNTSNKNIVYFNYPYKSDETFAFEKSCCSKNGTLFFGTNNGVTFFNPALFKKTEEKSRIQLTSIKVKDESGKLKDYKDEILYTKENNLFELPYHLNNIGINFSALTFDNIVENIYAYRIKNKSDEWIKLGSKNSLEFLNLEPGNYQFEIRNSNYEGGWSNNILSVPVKINPPFYKNLYFILFALLSVFALIFYLVRKRISSIEKRKTNLEELIKEKTRSEEKLKIAYSKISNLKTKLQEENTYLRNEINTEYDFTEFIFKSKKIEEILQLIKRIAPTDSSLLITGETGTGKELIARELHYLSKRSDRPMIKLNCAAIPGNLIESELFGYEKGAFTGADKSKPGKFEIAEGGTIFLDEIAEMPIELQGKLLRVLQEKEFERLGGNKTIKCDVRIVSATNKNLAEAITKKEFREDLYYRLNVFSVEIPPLRQRKEDIDPLVRYFMNKFSKKYDKRIEAISISQMQKFENYFWPGNIRELENVIERGVIINDGNKLIVDDSVFNNNNKLTESDLFLPLAEVEKKYIIDVLQSCNWKVSGANGAAEILGVKPTTLFSKMKKLEIKQSSILE